MIENLNKYIDHTLLKPEAGEKEISQLIDEAVKFNFASVCVNGCFVAEAAEKLMGTGIKVAAVVGFPLGAMSPSAKLAETHDALANGAQEIDTVINIGALKDECYDFVLSELKAQAELCHQYSAILKVIIETCLLTEDEIVKACHLVMDSGADFIKTSTGFSTGGATIDDVKQMKNIIGKNIKLKASGGIRTFDDAVKFIEAGADRLGCSASVAIMEEYNNKKISV